MNHSETPNGVARFRLSSAFALVAFTSFLFLAVLLVPSVLGAGWYGDWIERPAFLAGASSLLFGLAGSVAALRNAGDAPKKQWAVEFASSVIPFFTVLVLMLGW